MSLSIVKKELHKPNNEEIKEVILKGLKNNFKEVSCEVVDCPDLTNEPWGLAMSGLCGSPSIGEIGGVRYLCPLPQTSKLYDLRDIGEKIGYEDGLLIGAGAGPLPYIKKNSEMIPNIRIGSPLTNESRVAKTTDDDSKILLEKLPLEESRCSLLMNFFTCSGQTGPVLKINAKKRTGEKDFPGSIRKAILDHYGSNIVGLGGTFIMKTGTAKIHVMPEFSKSPLKSESDVNKWLKFYDVKGPMIFMSVLASQDPGLDFRVEHTHGYTSTEGGHYHFDTTPEDVEYEGYFSVAETMYRIDKP